MRLSVVQEKRDNYGFVTEVVVSVVAGTDGAGLVGSDGVGAGVGGVDWACVTVGSGAGRLGTGAIVGGTVSVGVRVTTGAWVTTGPCDGGCDGGRLGVPVCVALGVGVVVGVGVAVGVGVTLGVGVAVVVGAGVAVGLPLGLPVPVGLGVGVAVGVAFVVGGVAGVVVCVAVADGLGGTTLPSCTPPVTVCSGGVAPGTDQLDPDEAADPEPGW